MSAADAKTRFDRFLQDLAVSTPRTGLSVPTAAFIDDLIRRTARYGDHLFVCFDNPKIPATTNGLEGFFGRIKATLRRALGTGSTANTVMSNLAAEVMLVYQYIRRPDALTGVREPSATPADFSAARSRLHEDEAPAVRQRSIVRNFKRHLARLREAWKSADGP